MLAPRVYKAAFLIGFAWIFLAAGLWLCAIWPDQITKIFVSLAILYFVPAITMAFVSVTRKDPMRGKHARFKLPLPNDDQGQ